VCLVASADIAVILESITSAAILVHFLVVLLGTDSAGINEIANTRPLATACILFTMPLNNASKTEVGGTI
jgi:hypothetical protein